MSYITPTMLLDGYKLSHREMYPENTEYIYSTWTPRSSSYLYNASHIVAFGFQYLFKKYLIEEWNEGFFNKSKEEAITEYREIYRGYLGKEPDTKHLEDLHDLGYLPLEIRAAKEGALVPVGTPMLTIINTDPRFFWLTNSLESIISNIIWSPSTVATKALIYKTIITEDAKASGEYMADSEFNICEWQGHDFSMRGMSSLESTVLSGAAHLLSFKGSDSVPAIGFIKKYYPTDSIIAGSVNASEHSVASASCGDGSNHVDDEINLITRLLTEVYPEGIVSYVSDTYSLWDVLDKVLPACKDVIMNRDGKFVVRPDSGDPVRILTGFTNQELYDIPIYDGTFELHDGMYYRDKNDTNKIYKRHKKQSIEVTASELKGVVETLGELFGYTTNARGIKVLDTHIGALYGDAITPERAVDIGNRLLRKGWASTSVVYGIGSYSYNFLTRDCAGFAIKSTWGQFGGVGMDLFKDPITDSGLKTSHKGKVKILYKGNAITGCTTSENEGKEYPVVFRNGELMQDYSFDTVRSNLKESIVALENPYGSLFRFHV